MLSKKLKQEDGSTEIHMRVEIEEIVANKCLIGLGNSIANLVILYIHVWYYPEILLLNIYI